MLPRAEREDDGRRATTERRRRPDPVVTCPLTVAGGVMTEVVPEVLISEEKIRKRIGELAARISTDYADVDELIMVGILKGSFIFLADLSRAVTIPRSVDFMALSTYGASESTETDGAVRMIMDLRRNITGKHVLVVEDIVDTGHTLSYLLRNLAARQPASLKTCVLVEKPERREVFTQIDYLGFSIPDVWVVGCGLDWAERFRTLPFIGVVHPGR
jgi:hypoxanthine phosphoribosyltransferase